MEYKRSLEVLSNPSPSIGTLYNFLNGTFNCSILDTNLLARAGAFVLIAWATSPRLPSPSDGERGGEEGRVESFFDVCRLARRLTMRVAFHLGINGYKKSKLITI